MNQQGNIRNINNQSWLAPLQLAHATSAATFLVGPGLAPVLFKIDSAASILATFKRCANKIECTISIIVQYF